MDEQAHLNDQFLIFFFFLKRLSKYCRPIIKSNGFCTMTDIVHALHPQKFTRYCELGYKLTTTVFNSAGASTMRHQEAKILCHYLEHYVLFRKSRSWKDIKALSSWNTSSNVRHFSLPRAIWCAVRERIPKFFC